MRNILSALAMAATLAAPAAMSQETPITTPGPEGVLSGTFSGARDGTQPVVLIIPGSGPTDRDGNNPQGVSSASLRLLAEGLAERGVASVRIDKRGMFASAGAVPDANDVTLADYAADVLGWIATIRQETGAACVTLAGHSEGGLVALLAAKAGGADVCGIALLAAPGRPLRMTLEQQLAAVPVLVSSMPNIENMFARIEAGETVPMEDIPALLRGMFPPVVHPYLGDLFRTDPAQVAAAVPDVPLLLAYGQRDSQITMDDWEALRTVRADAVSLIMPFATHTLKDAPGDGAASAAATYTDANLPLTEGLASAVASFAAMTAQ